MNVNSFTLNLNSEHPDELRSFYRDVVGLPEAEGHGEGALAAAGAILIIDCHDGVNGPAREPQRYLLDFFVDDLAAEQARLEAQGVEFIRKAGREWWGGVISTFLDPDGNYGQLIQVVPVPEAAMES